MRVKKKRKFQRGGGVFTNPSGTEIPSGWGVKTKKPSVGGVWIFSGTAQCITLCSRCISYQFVDCSYIG